MQVHGTDKKKISFIINPISGTKGKAAIPGLIEEKLDHERYEYEILYTKGPKHATELAQRAAKKGATYVVAVGGDGTVNEVATGLMHTKTALGIIPMGSGNGLARHLKIPMDAEGAIECIQKGQVKTIDSVKVNDEAFFAVAGIGFDAQVAHTFAKAKKRGFLSYVTQVIKEYGAYEPQKVQLVVDGKEMAQEPFILTFANGSQYGNDVHIAPQAKIDDGLLDLVFMKKIPKRDMLSSGLRLMRKRLHHSPHYQSMRCQEVRMQAPKIIAHLDGEPRTYEGEIIVKVIPGSLRVITSVR